MVTTLVHLGFLAGKRFCFFTSINGNTWIIDSEASDHITADLSLLHDVKSIQNCCFITMPNGKQAQIKHVGSMVLTSRLILKELLHISDFHFNLLTISKLTRQYSANVIFTPDVCLLHDHTLEKVLILGRQKRGLYCLPPHCKRSPDTWDLLSDPTYYRTMIGELNFLSHTRPHLC